MYLSLLQCCHTAFEILAWQCSVQDNGWHCCCWLDARTLFLRQEEFQVHDVASVLRRFIRSLNEPLLTESARARWIETAST